RRQSVGNSRVIRGRMAAMEFRILGPLELASPEGQELPLRGRTQRAVMAVLLLHPNDVVAADRMIDELWADGPPETAAKIVHNAVSQLRKVLPADELEALVTRHPLRERLRGQLMLALYRAGRQADALDAYQSTRRLLIDELGIEPSTALQQLEKAILVHDPALEAARPEAASAPTPA